MIEKRKSQIEWYYLIVLLLFSIISQYVIGKYPTDLSSALSFNYLLPFLLFIILKKTNEKCFLFFLSIYFIFSTLLLAPSILYGEVSTGILASLYETNYQESLEYLKNIPSKVYICYLLYLSLFVFLLKINKKIAMPKDKRNLLLLILIIFSFAKPISYTIKNINNVNYYESFKKTSFYPARIILNLIENNRIYWLEKKEIEESLTNTPQWEIISTVPQYSTYVIIIGESMRKDYMSLYGYPFKNTTFLDRVNGIYFSNYVSAAPNTHPSLQRTLYRHSEKLEPIYTDSIISLAKSAGFKTYWLSNQGKFGEFDILASKIAARSDYIYFTKRGSYDSTNIDDTQLIPEFEKALSDKENKPKLIVLHLMGSHPLFCDRLTEKPEFKVISEQMSCYIATIQKTDQLIETINQKLVKQEKSYSVIYFSDHGLSHYSTDGNSISMSTNNLYKQNYSVPLIKFSSDDTTRQKIDTPKSAFHFMNGFAEWLGIQESHLKQENFFAENKKDKIENIKVFNWKEMIDFEHLANDPAILPK